MEFSSLWPSYWIFDDTFRTFLKNRSLFTNHTLSNQIQLSLDTFLKKSDSCGFFPQLTKRSWRNCHIWNWAQFCKEIAHFFLERRWETSSISFDWIVDPALCCLKKPSTSIGIFSRKADIWDKKSSVSHSLFYSSTKEEKVQSLSFAPAEWNSSSFLVKTGTPLGSKTQTKFGPKHARSSSDGKRSVRV